MCLEINIEATTGNRVMFTFSIILWGILDSFALHREGFGQTPLKEAVFRSRCPRFDVFRAVVL